MKLILLACLLCLVGCSTSGGTKTTTVKAADGSVTTTVEAPTVDPFKQMQLEAGRALMETTF